MSTGYVLDGRFGDYAAECLLSSATGGGGSKRANAFSVPRVLDSQSAFAKVCESIR